MLNLTMYCFPAASLGVLGGCPLGFLVFFGVPLGFPWGVQLGVQAKKKYGKIFIKSIWQSRFQTVCAISSLIQMFIHQKNTIILPVLRRAPRAEDELLLLARRSLCVAAIYICD
jgi:hypothetical protein